MPGTTPEMPDEPETNEPIPMPSDDTGIASNAEISEDEPAEPPASGEPDRVNVADPTAAAYWARHFQATVEQMHEAVEAAGHDPQRVAAHLGKPWPYTKSGIV